MDLHWTTETQCHTKYCYVWHNTATCSAHVSSLTLQSHTHRPASTYFIVLYCPLPTLALLRFCGYPSSLTILNLQWERLVSFEQQAVCFDQYTKAFKQQSGAGTCEAHRAWIDGFSGLRWASSRGRGLSLRHLLLYSCTMLKYSSSIDHSAYKAANAALIEYRSVMMKSIIILTEANAVKL